MNIDNLIDQFQYLNEHLLAKQLVIIAIYALLAKLADLFIDKILRRFAEHLGTWPQTVMTGSGAALIREDCDFVDNHVPHLVLKGIVYAYQKHWQASNAME